MMFTRLLDQQVETYRQTLQFIPFYKARPQQKEGILPEFKVFFSNVETAKLATEEKEFLQFHVHIAEESKSSRTYFKIMALRNHLLERLQVLTVTHPYKIVMDVTTVRGTEKPFLEIANIQLTQNCSKVNQALMDMIANSLIHFSMGETLIRVNCTYDASQ